MYAPIPNDKLICSYRFSVNFLQMATADLCAYIDNDHLNVRSEEDVATAILRWLRHRPKTRLTAMEHVMQVCCDTRCTNNPK